MAKSKKIQETQEGAPADQVRSDWKALMNKLSYRAVVTNIPYLAFLALLSLLYISNTQRAVETQRELNAKNKVLKELRWKYMDIKTQLLYTRMESQVIRKAAVIGLKPLMLPAYSIHTEEKKEVKN